MKKLFVIFLVIISVFALTACGEEENKDGTEIPSEEIGEIEATNGSKMTVHVGVYEFEANIFENETARAFGSILPLTVRMEAMPHEKYYYLPNPLVSDAKTVGRIEAGDIMLWGNDCLVVFYESFDTSYRYTRIGKIIDTNDLSAAVGSGSVTVTFRVS